MKYPIYSNVLALFDKVFRNRIRELEVDDWVRADDEAMRE